MNGVSKKFICQKILNSLILNTGINIEFHVIISLFYQNNLSYIRIASYNYQNAYSLH